MSYATLYVDQGNLLDFYEQRGDAEAAVLEVVQRHREVAEEFGSFAFDEDGQRQGSFVSGAELFEHRGTPA